MLMGARRYKKPWAYDSVLSLYWLVMLMGVCADTMRRWGGWSGALTPRMRSSLPTPAPNLSPLLRPTWMLLAATPTR